MSTIDHVTIRISDLDASRGLYERAFAVLGLEGRPLEGGIEWGDFSTAPTGAELPPTEGLHIAFTADSRELVDRWWRELVDAGYHSDGEPGPRPQYSPDYYGAFVLDLQGNSIEAMTRDAAREQPTGVIDHLWIRVDKLEAIKRFYSAIAPVAVLRARDDGERFRLGTERGSFTFLEGPATRNLHLAIGVGDQATVDAFHRAALDAGAADNGAPGERAHYHPGYYGAFVVDPAGTNLEAVYHGERS